MSNQYDMVTRWDIFARYCEWAVFIAVIAAFFVLLTEQCVNSILKNQCESHGGTWVIKNFGTDEDPIKIGVCDEPY